MNEPGSFGEMSLEQLGSHAYAHYKAGEKANQKANDHAKSSGLYLAEAKRRIDVEVPYGQRTQAWEGFLTAHCPVARTRAEQLIAVATGKTTEVEIQEKQRRANQSFQERNKAARKSVISNDKLQQLPEPPQPDTERANVMARIIQKLEGLSLAQLHDIERNIPNAT